MKRAAPFAVVLLLASSAWAGPKSLYLTNIGHYVKHHKLEVLGDFIMVGASAADVETSIRSQRTRGVCETNTFLGCRPSRAQLWAVKLPFIAGLAAVDRYVLKWSDSSNPVRTPEGLAIPAIWATVNAVTAHNNAKLIR